MHITALLPFLGLLIGVAQAQFQFFEQMFQGQQQQQPQQPQNVPSDSSWYQQNYQSGRALRAEVVIGAKDLH